MKRLIVFLSILFLVGCSTNTSLIEIKKHIYVEKEFECRSDSMATSGW